MPPERDTEARLTELEVQAAYRDRAVADLDEVVREFTAKIQAMERELETLRQAVTTAVGDGQPPPPADEKPPHY